MLKPSCVLAAMATLLLSPLLGFAKDKPKETLPYDVLQARTILVLIDPTAGVSLDNPQANEVAQRDVETALMNWGRYQVMLHGQHADLIVVVRRGSGKMATGTIHDPRQGRRPVVIDPTDTGIGVGIEHGRPPSDSGNIGGIPDASQGDSLPGAQSTPNDPINRRRHPQAEMGSDISEDSFVIYRGQTENPLDAPPVWRYLAKDCLKPHKVPAVEAFREAVDETEQAAAKQP
jgi:serine/threonine-protein kinase RIO1